jgi:RHS repeat-associated protein
MKTFYTLLLFLSTAGAFAQNNVVPDNLEFQALKDLWDSTNPNGTAWTAKTNWPTGTWPSSATSVQFGTWFGVTVLNGDITQIVLANNNLIGSIPSSIGTLTKLKVLSLAGNQLSGVIPDEIGNLTSLQSLLFSTNNLSGEIPSSIGGLSAVSTLSLQYNKLKGSIPPQIANLTHLAVLYLHNNQLSGTIPDVFTNVTDLRYFSLNANSFTGPLPATLGNATLMTVFTITNNKLSGTIPSTYAAFTHITNFYIDQNDFSGELPSFIGTWTTLSNLVVKQNRLSGLLPSTLSNCALLGFIDVSKNNFSGAFPSISATTLSYVTGNDNSFTSLPNTLTNGSALVQVNFQNNNLKAVPDFGTYNNRTNLVLNLQNNRLDFSKLEPNVGKDIKTLTQTPQKNVNDTTAVPIGASLTITARQRGGSTTLYWEKLSANGSAWGSVDNKDDDGPSNDTFRRNTATAGDEGTYRWKTTSGLMPGVTIYSDPIQVKTAQEFTLDNWAFQYKYDGRKRMTHKKIPGADWMYLVYDDRDRLVMTQDGEQRKTNKWTVTKYDLLNRPVVTGLYTHNMYVSQQGTDSLISKALFAETLVGSTYSTKVFPKTNVNILTQTYYDNYDFLAGDKYFKYDSARLIGQEQSAFRRLKGHITGFWTSTLGKDKQWLRTVNYYDDKSRIIQSISDNHKRGQDVITNVYDFVGKIIETKTESIDHHINWTNANQGAWVLEDRVIDKVTSAVYAFSSQQIASQGDGWVEFTCADGSILSTRTFGFSTSTAASQVGYGVKQDVTSTTNTIRVSENTTLKDSVRTVQGGDVIRIERKGATMFYSKNGRVFYSTTGVPRPVVYGHVILVQNNAELFNPKISVGGPTRSIRRHFSYDHAGRLDSTWHSLDNGPLVLLSKLEYNELGQLVDKKLHSTNSTDFRQSIDYRYNIRGWLTSMNGADLGPANSKNLDDAHERKDLFGLDLLYNESISGIGNSQLYNGNISAMRWSNNLGLGSLKERSYKFDYDPMNRLKSANQYKYNGAWVSSNAHQESGLTYDLNGNIQTLYRTDASGTLMDSLHYNYGYNENQGNVLLKVSDSGTKDGFTDVPGTDNDYTYDRNGNLITDNNKTITSITYNHLNLPEKVTKSTNEYLIYTYDATGRKLAQDLYTNTGVLKKRSDYRGEWFYENDTLRFVNHEEGRAVTEGQWGKSPQMAPDPEMVSASNCFAASGKNMSLSSVTLNTNSYLKVVNNQAVTLPGFTSGAINVVPGRTYTLRLRGYTQAGVGALYVLGNGYSSGNILWPGAQLPQGASNEAWVESRFTVPMTMSKVFVGALWTSGATAGAELYVNTMELYEYNGVHGNATFAQSGYTYQYHLKDHLGNVRMTFTTKDEKEESLATLEDLTSDFLYYDEAIKINSTIFDHTDTASTQYSTRLNGTEAERFGLAKSLSVMPGDTINMEVWAKYLNPNSSTWSSTLSDFIASMAPGGSAPAGTFIDGGLLGSTGGLLPFWSLFTPAPEENNASAPKAYLNWLIFDRNYILKDGGAIQVSTDAEEHGEDGSHEELSKQLPIAEAGYVYVYLSNDNVALGGEVVEVYFDDFKVEHEKSPVIESSDYYPFGLTFNNYQRENSLISRKKFQSQEHIDDLGLNWDSFKWRNHQPDIGRFFNIDPLADKYVYNSPYTFSENRVINAVELEGLEALMVNSHGHWIERTRTATGGQVTSATSAVGTLHPIAATSVGMVEPGSTNTSSVSGRIGRHMSEGGNMTSGDGGEQNAFRHALWSATITQQFGAETATQITNAHEGIGPTQPVNIDFSKPLVQKTGLADGVVDILNNAIGRDIAGGLSGNASSKDIAAAVLNYQKDVGLWNVSTDKDGNVSIQRSQITQKQYDTGMKKLGTLDNNGFNDADRKKMENDKKK